MTRDQVKEIIGIMKLQYPNFNADKSNLTQFIDLWAVVLNDFTEEQVKNGLMNFIRSDTKGFAPVPGQIIEQIKQIEQYENPQLNEQEAWAIVYKAICRGNYYAKDAFEKMPEEVQKAAGSADNIKEWAQTSLEMMGAVESQFKRTYNSVLKQKQQFAKLPSQTQERLLEMAHTKPQAQIEVLHIVEDEKFISQNEDIEFDNELEKLRKGEKQCKNI